MRKGFDTLAALVKEFLGQDPLSGHLFVFINRRRDRVKLLYWCGDGFAIWYRRLEKGTFELPSAGKDDVRLEMKASELSLILDGIEDPQNLGSLIRTAEACGVKGVIIPKDRAVGITPSVIKASAGSTAHLPVVRVVNIANTIDFFKNNGVWVYGAAAEAKTPIYELDFTIDLAIVIGSEGKGIRPLVEKKCDRLFSIPMAGPIASFNASVSGGMVLYEVMRQRRIMKRHSSEFGDFSENPVKENIK
jgi:tRNA G18 (ribose-2'-O)-methylase SpoU